MIDRLLNIDTVRFGVVSVLGLGIDISFAWLLATLAGLPLPLAAVGGFAAGAAFNYMLHEYWTFRAAESRASIQRGLIYVAVLAVVLGARVAAVAILERSILAGTSQKLEALLLATAFSFAVNYVLSKYLVFRRLPSRSTSDAA